MDTSWRRGAAGDEGDDSAASAVDRFVAPAIPPARENDGDARGEVGNSMETVAWSRSSWGGRVARSNSRRLRRPSGVHELLAAVAKKIGENVRRVRFREERKRG